LIVTASAACEAAVDGPALAPPAGVAVDEGELPVHADTMRTSAARMPTNRQRVATSRPPYTSRLWVRCGGIDSTPDLTDRTLAQVPGSKVS